MENTKSKYLKKKEIAIYCNVSTRTINNWMARRIIPHIRIGSNVLFDPEKVDNALNEFQTRTITE